MDVKANLRQRGAQTCLPRAKDAIRGMAVARRLIEHAFQQPGVEAAQRADTMVALEQPRAYVRGTRAHLPRVHARFGAKGPPAGRWLVAAFATGLPRSRAPTGARIDAVERHGRALAYPSRAHQYQRAKPTSTDATVSTITCAMRLTAAPPRLPRGVQRFGRRRRAAGCTSRRVRPRAPASRCPTGSAS